MAVNAEPTPPDPTSRILMSQDSLSGRGVWRRLVPRRTLTTDVGHDVLDARVVLEAVHGQVLAVAGVLEAAVRHLRDERDVGVDPDHAEVELARHAERPRVVLGPDAGGQAVLDTVGPAECLRLVGELLDRH